MEASTPGKGDDRRRGGLDNGGLDSRQRGRQATHWGLQFGRESVQHPSMRAGQTPVACSHCVSSGVQRCLKPATNPLRRISMHRPWLAQVHAHSTTLVMVAAKLEYRHSGSVFLAVHLSLPRIRISRVFLLFLRPWLGHCVPQLPLSPLLPLSTMQGPGGGLAFQSSTTLRKRAAQRRRTRKKRHGIHQLRIISSRSRNRLRIAWGGVHSCRKIVHSSDIVSCLPFAPGVVKAGRGRDLQTRRVRGLFLR
jgi:hypothetical protein